MRTGTVRYGRVRPIPCPAAGKLTRLGNQYDLIALERTESRSEQARETLRAVSLIKQANGTRAAASTNTAAAGERSATALHEYLLLSRSGGSPRHEPSRWRKSAKERASRSASVSA